MNFFTNIECVNIPLESVRKAAIFSKEVTATTNYSDTNQFSIAKIKDDHFISKLGEEAAKIVLAKYTLVTGPDYNIYLGKEKSWEDDLYVDETGIAVKTQRKTAAQKFGLSWTFQCGNFRRDVILDKPEAWVIFVEYNDLHPYNCNVYPPFQIKELSFGEPKLSKLRGHKKVVYADTLKF
ncbi:MAG TPA: hypothetical protein PL009_03815 [Flavipsychrobacter sp.]|nr:hypothetical protein [Flavipsychrobacter sp.]